MPRGLLAAWCRSSNNYEALNLLGPYNAIETLDVWTEYGLVIAVGNSNLAAQLADCCTAAPRSWWSCLSPK